MDAGLLFGGIAAVNRFVEFAKTYVDRLNLNEDTRALFLRLLAFLGGILVTLISDGRINILEGINGIHPLVSLVVTGLTLGLGADFANALLGLLYGWNNPTPPPTDPTLKMGDKG